MPGNDHGHPEKEERRSGAHPFARHRPPVFRRRVVKKEPDRPQPPTAAVKRPKPCPDNEAEPEDAETDDCQKRSPSGNGHALMVPRLELTSAAPDGLQPIPNRDGDENDVQNAEGREHPAKMTFPRTRLSTKTNVATPSIHVMKTRRPNDMWYSGIGRFSFTASA